MVALLLLGGIFIYFTRIGWFTNFIMSILNFSDDNFTSKLILYLTREQFAQSRTLSFGVLVYILAVAIALFNYKELVKIKYFNIFFNLFLINVLIYFYCYELIELTNRVRWFFFIGIIIILPDYIIILKNKLNKLTYCTAIICLCFLYARLIFMESSATLPYNPYQNYVVYKVFNLNSTGMERTLIYNNQ
jgi:hypothetical protein